ncbi:hypothetical protein SAMN05421855_1341 [Ulvibacter litoralis]|uniref:DUF3805 domain-containing protein n=2 Tax=Ulvibacter litoralis TaxID=227084 RepID=A0A1G7JWS2_9FLAO|nr:hypothetical protein SAMN05421855_1341 [Ulvibacter litoralis]
MIKYIPSTARYHIFHPKDYIINEDKDGIVTITSPNGETNMTLSGYEANGEVDSKVLTEFMAEVTKGYELQTEPELKEFGNGLKISGKYKKDGNDWLWKIFSENKAIVIVSINGDGILSDEEIKLIEFMLDNFELYSE